MYRLFTISASLDTIVISVSEEYRADSCSISVVVEWTRREGVSYNITIVPMVPVTYTGSTSVQLIVSYNTEYNVSLEASAVCQRSIASRHIRIPLFYGESYYC
jgi:hypothetical protein